MISLKRSFLLGIILILLGVPLFSAVEASYFPEPSLRFYRAYNYGPFFMEADPNASNADFFVAHLGTLIFTSTDGKLFNPTMINIATNINFTFRGMMDNGEENSIFRLASAYRKNNSEEWVRLDHGNDVNSLTNTQGNLNTSNFEVRLYLLSDQPASRYVYNAIYTWVSGSFGGFNIQVKKDQNVNDYTYVPVNGQIVPSDGTAPSVPEPMLVGGATDPKPLPYGDLVYNTEYLFSIQNVRSFALSSAYGTKLAPIATANLELVQTDPNKDYGVNVKFSNQTGSDIFRLHLQDTQGIQYLIPYTLTFGGSQVVPNVDMPWSGLDTANPNTKEIGVTGINPNIAERGPEGNYMDTIEVYISPM